MDLLFLKDYKTYRNEQKYGSAYDATDQEWQRKTEVRKECAYHKRGEQNLCSIEKKV